MFIDLKKADNQTKKEAAIILYEASKAITLNSWKTIEEAIEEVEECLNTEYIASGYIENGHLIGWVGARPLYGNITWEIHPLMVKSEYQKKGIGTKLLREIEKKVKEKGAINIFLGTDDELGKTSLSKVELEKSDIFDEIKKIKNLDNHPYEFYMKNGYKIIGVIPDANGPNKPDILMWKRL